jgi:RimJ/RimL family protein N-acetyltransferase
MKRFLYYAVEGSHTRRFVDDSLQAEIWRPSWCGVVPPGVRRRALYAYWLFHYGRVFRNRDYCLVVIRDQQRVAHYSAAYPGFFRFPFMAADDLQIGAVWTEPEYRGRGLAKIGVDALLAEIGRRERKVWYVVDEENAPSIRVAQNVGFSLVGAGVKQPRFRLSLLGAYVITDFPSVAQRAA